MDALKPIKIPDSHNYLAVFLTLACNLKCSYCINHFGTAGFEKGHLSGEEWARALNRIESRPDLPITLQGGEPTIHKGFYQIVNNVKPELNMDLLTNLQFDAAEFMANVKPDRIKRNAPYASIRVSYHPEQMELEPLVEKTLVLLNAGYSIGIWGVLHPSQEKEILRAKEYATRKGIDFRTKEFLGEHEGKMYGTYKYPEACSGTAHKEVMCKTTELIVGPSGGVYRCHSDLYEGRAPVGNLLDPAFEIQEIYRPCKHYGRCNPCDIKVTTNRFQQFGHTSVDIIFPEEQKKAG